MADFVEGHFFFFSFLLDFGLVRFAAGWKIGVVEDWGGGSVV